MKTKCRICGKKTLTDFINFGSHPIVHHLKKIKNKSKRFPFNLVICKICKFQQVLKPISPKILYENYLTLSSEKNQPHITRFVEVLESISSCDKNSKIFEIGCNDGILLDELKKKKI